jgi:hypothetical protein
VNGTSAADDHEGDKMPAAPSRSPLHWFAKAALWLNLALSSGALGGGAALMIGPRGEVIPLPLSNLRGSPFDTYFVPGLILFGVLGLGPLLAAWLVWLRHPLAPLATCVVGGALLVWLAVEIAIIGFSVNPPLQPIYLVLGAAIVAVGLTWLARNDSPPS